MTILRNSLPLPKSCLRKSRFCMTKFQRCHLMTRFWIQNKYKVLTLLNLNTSLAHKEEREQKRSLKERRRSSQRPSCSIQLPRTKTCLTHLRSKCRSLPTKITFSESVTRVIYLWTKWWKNLSPNSFQKKTWNRKLSVYRSALCWHKMKWSGLASRSKTIREWGTDSVDQPRLIIFF